MAKDKAALILAGGSGTRFWPWSRPERPKQYLKLVGDRSLLQQTVDRVSPLFTNEEIFVCSSQPQEALLREQLPQLSGWILEPEGKNTAAALMLSTATMLQRGCRPDLCLVALPADHYIADPGALRSALKRAIEFAKSHDALVTLGVIPTTPHTGYGYIESAIPDGDIRPVKRFVEKPNRERAVQFLQSGQFFWNSGIFIWRLEVLVAAFEKFMPEAWHKFQADLSGNALGEVYTSLRSVPIDVGVLEKADNVYVIPVEMGWSDIGSWDALHGLQREDGDANVILSGNAKLIDTTGCLVKTDSTTRVALVGVRDLIVVEDGDTLLIAARSHDQQVRKAAEHFELDGD